jgi:hypothetical protein
MGGPGSGRPKGSINSKIPIKINWSNSNYKNKYDPEIELPKDIEIITKEIFYRISYNCPWIMSPIKQESINQLIKSVGNIIYRNK